MTIAVFNPIDFNLKDIHTTQGVPQNMTEGERLECRLDF